MPSPSEFFTPDETRELGRSQEELSREQVATMQDEFTTQMGQAEKDDSGPVADDEAIAPTLVEATDSQSGEVRPSNVTSTQTTGASDSPEALSAELADASNDCHGPVDESFQVAATQVEAAEGSLVDHNEEQMKKEAAVVKQAESMHAQVTAAASASQDVVDLPEEVQPRG